ncbi:MAG: hypothetical protein C5B55_03220 [Blastocatellia bacterium]|nr:MAG: hypothetical protein C5B55_03220 [Blastocatellia bacterium]
MFFVKSILPLVVVIFVVISCVSRSTAQSTLFNIPSTDVVAKKKVYLEFDFLSHFESHESGGFQGYVPRAVIGVGKRTEVGVNVAFADVLAPDQPVELQPNVKHQFYQNEKAGVTIAGGAIAYLPIAHRVGTDSFGMLYTVVSKQVKGSHSPRFTGGAYGLVGRVDGTGTKGGAIGGYEQPLVPGRLSFVADWFSGKNRFGYVTPGFAITVSKTSLFYAGYSVGNQGRKNNALFLYYGITF